ncbi:hypothetical protein KAU11_03080 [Candidatus Babeliales bacterium]|nr:hypothetical protein [Candidatus Babeliales bacterium]
MPVDISTKDGKKAYSKEIKGRESVLKIQERALSLNEQKTQSSEQQQEKISAAKRLALAKKADKTELAALVNKGMFALTFPVCKNKKLNLKDVEEVNFGGAVVGILVYYIPNFNFQHPIVILISRGIALFLKIRNVCGGIENVLKKGRKSEIQPEAGGQAKGHGKDEREPEKDYIEAGKVVDGMIAGVMKKQP